jgi:ADP-heptose:LPS heptosyltransferase
MKTVDFLGGCLKRKTPRSFSSPSKIVVSEIGHIGDAMFSTPVYSIIKKNFPNSEIWALVNSCAEELLEDNPNISRIITYNHFRLARHRGSILKKISENISEAIKIIKIFRNNKFDLGIDLRHFYPMTILLMSFGRIKYIAGFGNRGFSFLLDKQFDLTPDFHEVEHKVQALGQLGLMIPPKDEIKLELYFDDKTILKVRTLLSCVSVTFHKPIAVIHPGTGQPSRLWSEQNWAKVADFLIKQDIQLIFAGGKSENDMICKIMNIIGGNSKCWNLCAKLSLKEFAALAKAADFLIGLESASSHIAAAVGTPVVSIYSGTTKTSQWRPWGEKVFIIKKDMPCAPCYNPVGCQNMNCLRSIEADDVINIIDKKIIPGLNKQKNEK